MVAISFAFCFEDPYWIGLIEESSGGNVEIGKVVFGAEPSNAEIMQFALHNLHSVSLHKIDGLDLTLWRKKLSKSIKSSNGTKRSLDIYKLAL